MLVTNKEKLNEIFNINSESNSETIDVEAISIPYQQNEQQRKLTTEADVYEQLGKLILTGNDVFANVKMILDDNPDAELLASATSLLNTIKDIMKEFTHLHNQTVKFEQQKEMEMLKAQLRQQQILLKSKETQKLMTQRMNMANNPDMFNDKPVEMVPYCQEEVVKALAAAKESTQTENPQ